MTDRKINAPHPPHLPAEHLQDPRLSILDASGDAVLSYCRQTHTGSVFRLGTGMWMLVGPITLEAFLASVESMGIVVGDDAALHAWLDAITGGRDEVADLIARAKSH